MFSRLKIINHGDCQKKFIFVIAKAKSCLCFSEKKFIFYSSSGIHGKKTGQNVTEQVDARRVCLHLPGVRGRKEQNL